MKIEVRVAPVPWSRARIDNRSGRPRFYKSPDLIAYQNLVGGTFLSARWGQGNPGLLTGPLRVDLFFVLPRPRKATDTGQATRKPDLDNLTKTILDALNGIAWVDDAQVVELKATKRFVEDGASFGPGVRITVEGL
jgi:Holliday junction resolvase RusA-like endonuclease